MYRQPEVWRYADPAECGAARGTRCRKNAESKGGALENGKLDVGGGAAAAENLVVGDGPGAAQGGRLGGVEVAVAGGEIAAGPAGIV